MSGFDLGGTTGRTEAAQSALVRELWEHFERKYHTKVVAKASAAEMKAAAWALNKMGITGTSEFLEHFVTTIGHTIYTPFVVGVPMAGWSLWAQVSVCAHEHQHVVQLERDGAIKFFAKYLLSAARRAELEVDAYRCDMELWWWHRGEMLDAGELANQLLSYGCRPEDVVTAERSLRSAAVTVEHGGLITEAAKVAVSWLAAHAPDLRHPSPPPGGQG